MLSDIKKRMVILENRKPFDLKAKEYLENSEKTDWVYMNLRLASSQLSKESLETIVNGGVILEASIKDHIMIEILQKLRGEIYSLRDMHEELSKETLNKFYFIASNGQTPNYRKSNPVIVQLSHNPTLPQEIEGEIKKMFFSLYADNENIDIFERAAIVHNKIIKIYPYPDNNELIARVAMLYILVQNGYPICSLSLSEQEYNQALADYMRNGNVEKIYQSLLRGTFNKLEIIMQLIKSSDASIE